MVPPTAVKLDKKMVAQLALGMAARKVYWKAELTVVLTALC